MTDTEYTETNPDPRLREVAEHNAKAGGYCTCGDCYYNRVIVAGYCMRWAVTVTEYQWRGYNRSRVVAKGEGGSRTL